MASKKKLSELLAALGRYEETRTGFLALCPAHNDSNPSLRITVSALDKVLVRCRVGCATKDVMAKVGWTMKDLATAHADVLPARTVSGNDAPASPAEVAKLRVKLEAYAAAYPGSLAEAYASDRFGVTREAAAAMMLGYAEDLTGGPRLVVPFMDAEGVARGYQARALDPDEHVRWVSAPSPDEGAWAKVAWFPGTAGRDEIIAAEGISDALSASAAGYDTLGIRGASLASSTTALTEMLDLIDHRPVVIMGDGDEAGRAFTNKLAAALSKHGVEVRTVDMPEGQDLTDWRNTDPLVFPAELKQAVANAPSINADVAALMAWDTDVYALTDLGGARYLRDYIESIGSGVKFTDEAGFYLLDNGVWRRDDRQEVRTRAHEVADTLRELADIASRIADANKEDKHAKSVAGRFRAYAMRAQTSAGLDAMVREVQAVDGVACSINDFDKDPDLLAVRNGVIHLPTGKLREHNPALMLSRRVDVNYRPGAQAPRWEAFLREVMPNDPDMPEYLRRLVGYGITGHTDEECFVVNWGNGANGKSVFCDTLTDVFGEHAVTTPFSTFEARQSSGIPNDIAAMKGSRLVMASEGESGKSMAEGMLKRLTGRDKVTARFMRREFFSYKPEFLIMLSTNYKPRFKGADEGLWRRVKLVEWSRYFAPHERDYKLPDKLLAEAEGILAWAVEGARQWYDNGLNDPAAIKAATAEYRATSDQLAGFLPGIFVKANGYTVTGKEMIDAYRDWAAEEGLTSGEVWKRRTLFEALVERGLVQRQTSDRGLVFEGVRRATPADNPAADTPAPAPEPEPEPEPKALTVDDGPDLDDLL